MSSRLCVKTKPAGQALPLHDEIHALNSLVIELDAILWSREI